MFLGMCALRGLMIVFGKSRHGVEATRISGMAAKYAAGRKIKPFGGTVDLYGFYGIRRACGVEAAAGGVQRRKETPV